MYGPGVYPEIPAEVLAGQSVPGHGWGKSPPEEQARRSIYIHVKRSLLMPILESFDLAETDRSTPGALHHDAADAGPGHAQQRIPERAGRQSSPTGCAARPATTWPARCAWRLYPGDGAGRRPTPKCAAAWP